MITIGNIWGESEDDWDRLIRFRSINCGIEMNSITHGDFNTPIEIHILFDLGRIFFVSDGFANWDRFLIYSSPGLEK